jgi:hypothetical protein
MLALPQSIHQQISNYLSDNDRLHLMYICKQLFDIWVVELYKIHRFGYKDINYIDTKYHQYIKSIIIGKHEKKHIIKQSIYKKLIKNIRYYSNILSYGYFYQKKKKYSPLNYFPLNLESLFSTIHYKAHKQSNPNSNDLGINYKLIPPTLKYLVFGEFTNFNLTIEPGLFPNGLRVLVLNSSYNQPIPKGVLPHSLISLSFGQYFNQPISNGVLPPNLKTLVFARNFNQRLLPGSLPQSLEELAFGMVFHRRFYTETLPSRLKIKHHFLSDSDYNHSFEPNVLPRNLKTLILNGGEFEHRIPKGILPNTLEKLYFRECFRAPYLYIEELNETYPNIIKSDWDLIIKYPCVIGMTNEEMEQFLSGKCDSNSRSYPEAFLQHTVDD